jgi:hypothetical protein
LAAGAPWSAAELRRTLGGIRKPQSHQKIANAHLSSGIVEAQQ